MIITDTSGEALTVLAWVIGAFLVVCLAEWGRR
jgi:hypothetical protein